MNNFGSNEYGNKEGFKVVCNKCGKEGWIVPIHHYENDDYKNPSRITLELRCSCGNKYGGTIHRCNISSDASKDEMKYYEIRAIGYDENNIPYTREYLYGKSKTAPSKEEVLDFCKEKTVVEVEDIFLNEISENEILEYFDSLEEVEEI